MVTFDALQPHGLCRRALALLWLAMLLLGTGDGRPRDPARALRRRSSRGWRDAARAGDDARRLAAVVTVCRISVRPVLLSRQAAWPALVLLVGSFWRARAGRSQKDYFARLRPEENLRLVEVHNLSRSRAAIRPMR